MLDVKAMTGTDGIQKFRCRYCDGDHRMSDCPVWGRDMEIFGDY